MPDNGLTSSVSHLVTNTKINFSAGMLPAAVSGTPVSKGRNVHFMTPATKVMASNHWQRELLRLPYPFSSTSTHKMADEDSREVGGKDAAKKRNVVLNISLNVSVLSEKEQMRSQTSPKGDHPLPCCYPSPDEQHEEKAKEDEKEGITEESTPMMYFVKDTVLYTILQKDSGESVVEQLRGGEFLC